MTNDVPPNHLNALHVRRRDNGVGVDSFMPNSKTIRNLFKKYKNSRNLVTLVDAYQYGKREFSYSEDVEVVLQQFILIDANNVPHPSYTELMKLLRNVINKQNEFLVASGKPKVKCPSVDALIKHILANKALI